MGNKLHDQVLHEPFYNPNKWRPKREQYLNVAGIIPVAYNDEIDKSFNFLWHDCFMPVGENLMAIEKTLIEMSKIGVKSIWIGCNDDVAPLLKRVLGDFIYDCNFFNEGYNNKVKQIKIPIFYIPCRTREYKKLNSITWTILNCAINAWYVSKCLSFRITPDKFYVSFPYAIQDSEKIWEQKRKIMWDNEQTYIRYNGQTVKDGKMLGFTMFPNDIKIYGEWMEHLSSWKYYDRLRDERGKRMKERTGEDLFKSKRIHFKEFFSKKHIEPSAKFIDIPYFYELTSWEEYGRYMSDIGKNETRENINLRNKTSKSSILPNMLDPFRKINQRKFRK